MKKPDITFGTQNHYTWFTAFLAGMFVSAGSRPAQANPEGANVVHGSANISSQGSQLNIRTSDRTFIDWRSFNIAPNEITRFLQPSANSVVWNRINDENPSQILGGLTANGLVVLQNQNGIFFGPRSSVSVGGLIVTTSPSMPSDFFGGGSWSFGGPPPEAKIENYGTITAAEGGSVFLIGMHLENHGTIEAPSGQVGLYAGKEVTVSARPDGRGLSAQVRLPAGAVDNLGRITADAGTIALHAAVVNQGGALQADSIREKNGVVELFASESVHLSASSTIHAQGGAQGSSAGGTVQVVSKGTLSDEKGSSISVAGGTEGGNGGVVELSAPVVRSIQSTVDGSASAGSKPGHLIIDPKNVTISYAGSSASSGTIGSGEASGQDLVLDLNSFSSFSDILIQATDNINVSSSWTLQDGTKNLTLQAGNNISLNNSVALLAGAGCSIQFIAGADFSTPSGVIPGKGTITLEDRAIIQTRDGDISLRAGKDIVLTKASAVRTVAGGNIEAFATAGNINTGTSPNGYLFSTTDTGYSVSEQLGGISTAHGGNVALTAGGNITSYLPTGTALHNDAGSGAFGPEAGNVSLNAGGNIFGHYVVANGQGTIQAGKNVGSKTSLVAMSLVKGSWSVKAPAGSIYLQEVRNPNGVFNKAGAPTLPTNHRFDYDPSSSVFLQAANSITLKGGDVPRAPGENVPLLYPPNLTLRAGSGGIQLGKDVTLFPSPQGQLDIQTTDGGSLSSLDPGTIYNLVVSDSSRTKWSPGAFALNEHANIPIHLEDNQPIQIAVAGDLKDILLVSPKRTDLRVNGDMLNSGLLTQNLKASDVTQVTVGGKIFNRNDFTFASVTQDPDLNLLVDALLPDGTPAFRTPPLVYNADLKRVGFQGRMDQATRDRLKNLQVKTYKDGVPVTDEAGNFITQAAKLVPDEVIDALYIASQDVPSTSGKGFQIGGPGKLKINAGSLDLGVTEGVLSYGPSRNNSLARIAGKGADIEIALAGDLDMFSSAIGSTSGGSINIVSGGEINIGSQELLGFGDNPRGVYTTQGGSLDVTARGTIDVAGSRIAAYNGGDMHIKSLEGNINAGNGGVGSVRVERVIVDPVTFEVTNIRLPIAGSGIQSTVFPDSPQSISAGNVTLETPRGDIISSKGGIVQIAYNGNQSLNTSVTLKAGTVDAQGNVIYRGNVDVRGSGVIGGNVKVEASGNVDGLIVARGNTDVKAVQNFSGVIVSGGNSSVNAGGSVSGTVIGVGGVSANATSVDANILSQNVSVSGATSGQVGLAASTSVSSTSQSAAQQSTAAASSDATSSKTLAETDEDQKKQKPRPVLAKSVSRVTVILPAP